MKKIIIDETSYSEKVAVSSLILVKDKELLTELGYGNYARGLNALLNATREDMVKTIEERNNEKSKAE